MNLERIRPAASRTHASETTYRAFAGTSFALAASCIGLVLTSCGARSELWSGATVTDVPAPRDTTSDAPADAPSLTDVPAVPDVPVPTDGTTAWCNLRVVAGPVVVHTNRTGAFRAPELAARSDHLDAVASFEPFTDDRVPSAVARTLRVSPDGSIVLGPVAQLRPGSGVRIAVNGSQLGGCFALGESLAMQRWFTYEPAEMPAFLATGAGPCIGLAQSIGPWYAAFRARRGDTFEPMIIEASPERVPLGPPRAALTMVRTPGRDVTLTSFSRGAAWASAPDNRGVVEVGVSVDGRERHFVLTGHATTARAPARVAAWTPDDRLIAAAAHGFMGIVVTVATLDGTQQLRSPPLGFSMAHDTVPALVRAPFGVAVATLGYGDDDPQGGQLTVTLLNAATAGPVGAPIVLPVRRADLNITEVSGAMIGETVVFHWSGINPAMPTETNTYALALRCR